jgi:hypothetical protein
LYDQPGFTTITGMCSIRHGKGAVPRLIALLDDDTHQVRFEAAQALAMFGPAARGAVPRLIEMLKDPPWRDRAATTLGSIGLDAKAAVAPLIAAFQEPDKAGWARQRLAVTFAQLGPAAKEAVPALTAALHDDKDQVVVAAAYALTLLAPDEVAPVAPLRRVLENPKKDATIHLYAAAVLLRRDAKDKQAEAVLRAALGAPHIHLPQQSLRALNWLGPDAPDFRPEVRKLLIHNDEGIAAEARRMLRRLAARS